MTFSLVCGDVFGVLKQFPDNYFDALLSDPPYGFPGGFMGRGWDNLGPGQRQQAWHLDWLSPSLRVLKPGGRVIAASSSRTYHRLASAAEDAGFTVDPLFAWIQGQSMAQGGAIDKLVDKAAGAEREVVSVRRKTNQTVFSGADRGGWANEWEETAPATPLAARFEGYATRLKDSVTPWLMAHRPPDGSWAENASKHGLAGLAVDAGRVGSEPRVNRAAGNRGGGSSYQMSARGMPADAPSTERLGRYPANLALSEEAAQELGRQSGERQGGNYPRERSRSRVAYGRESRRQNRSGESTPAGTAARFFHRFRYHPKAARAERLKGCERLFWRVAPNHPLGFEPITQAEYLEMGHLPGCRPHSATTDLPLAKLLGLEIPEPGCADGCPERLRYQGNIHPTLKPIGLVRYLARLILPPPRDEQPRRLLVPFAGTGSEMIAALDAGWDDVVGIEMEHTYCKIALARMPSPCTP